MRNMLAALTVALMCTFAAAQVATRTGETVATQPVAPVAVGPQLNALLTQVDRAAETANADLSQLHIEKWKAKSDVKSQSQSNADLVQRNLTGTLPGLIMAVRSAPASLAPTFKLYENLDALGGVLTPLAESAGAFGPKSDYEALARDANALDQARRALGDRVYDLAVSTDAEVAQLRTKLAAAQAAVPPKKIVIDENAAPERKPVRKKKPVAKKKPATETPAAKPQ